jgi:hypothetical protein
MAIGPATAFAVNPSYNNGYHNSCYYAGQSAFDYGVYAHSQTSSYCADLLTINAYFFENSTLRVNCSTFGTWSSSSPQICEVYGGSINNVYGYHQIQEPTTNMSTTRETHAQ